MIPVVAVAAPVSGLDKVARFLRRMPKKPGVAFVVMQPLAPSDSSRLPELIDCSDLPTTAIEDQMPIQANRVYLVPPGHGATIEAEQFRLSIDDSGDQVTVLIDEFMRSLASICDGRSVGIVMAGIGSDGMLGMEAVGAAGGLALAEEVSRLPASASSMDSRCACIATVYEPESMADQLIEHLGRHRLVANVDDPESRQSAEPARESVPQTHATARAAANLDHGATQLSPERPVLERGSGIDHLARESLLREFTRAAVLVNRRLEVLCSYGPVHEYLAFPMGPVSLGLLEMTAQSWKPALISLTDRLFDEGTRQEIRLTSAAGLPIQATGLYLHDSRPTAETAEGVALITFHPISERDPRERFEASSTDQKANRSDNHNDNDNDKREHQCSEPTRSVEYTGTKHRSQPSAVENDDRGRCDHESIEGCPEDAASEKITDCESLDHLFSAAGVSTIALDRDFRIRYFTPPVTQLMSLVEADVGRRLEDISFKFVDADFFTDAIKVLDDRSVRFNDVYTHDNRWFRRRTASYARESENANAEGIVVTFFDIDPLKRETLAHQENQQRFENALSAINAGIWEMPVDPDTLRPVSDAIFISARLKRLIGFEAHEFPDSFKAWRNRVLPEDRQRLSETALFERERCIDGVRYRIRHRDGSTRQFVSFGILIRAAGGDDAASRWVGIESDITSQGLGTSLRAIESQRQLLADAVSTMVLFMDNRNIVQFSNATFNDWLGSDQSQVIGSAFDERLLGGTGDSVLATGVESTLAGHVNSCHLRIERDRVQQDLHLRLVPYADKGQVLGYYALITNVTNHNRRAVDRQETRSSLVHVHRMATIGEMAATLAHDLNQPLGSINTYASALTQMLHSGRTTEDSLPVVRKIVDQVQRATNIINQTREFVGRKDEQWEPIHINELVHRALSVTEGRAAKLNVDTHLDVHNGLPPVNGYAVQIEQLLINLISNALDTLENVSSDRRRLWLSTEYPDREFVQITIADSGEGIAADKIGHVFDAFHTTKLNGMGMGLAISRAIVEWHGGKLWVESRYGHGASFYIRLPVP